MSEIRIYDSSTIDTYIPQTEHQHKALLMLRPLFKEGVQEYIDNVQTQLFALSIEGELLPLTVNEQEYENSYVVSNYYYRYHLEGLLSTGHPVLRFVKKPLSAIVGMALRAAGVNKVVIVNNWLFSTTLYPELSSKQIQEITQFLKKAFPGHVLMFRNITTFQQASFLGSFKKTQFSCLKTRSVFVYDPHHRDKLSPKAQSHHKKDWRLIEKEGYEIIQGNDIKESDFARIIELYNQVYCDKHTAYSPAYNVKFLVAAFKSRFLDFIALKKEGKIDGVIGCFSQANVMSIPFFGFETHHSHSSLLYRMMTMLIIKEAEKRSLLLNDGSGGEDTKRYRGLRPFPEYTAVYSNHLPWRKRIFWKIASIF